MKSAENRLRTELTAPLNGTRERCIFGEGEMRPDVIVIGGIGSKHPAQMGFTEDDDMIEAFPADRADQPFRMPVLPR
jgi:hypothetical protein